MYSYLLSHSKELGAQQQNYMFLTAMCLFQVKISVFFQL